MMGGGQEGNFLMTLNFKNFFMVLAMENQEKITWQHK